MSYEEKTKKYIKAKKLKEKPQIDLRYLKDERETPEKLFLDLDREFNFTLDPCCTEQNAKCKKFFTKKEDGLVQDWSEDVVFMNPPYSAILTWIKKAHNEALKGATVACLIISDTSTTYWHEYCLFGKIRFIRGRLKFGDNRYPAPFPSVIVIFDQEIRQHESQLILF